MAKGVPRSSTLPQMHLGGQAEEVWSALTDHPLSQQKINLPRLALYDREGVLIKTWDGPLYRDRKALEELFVALEWAVREESTSR